MNFRKFSFAMTSIVLIMLVISGMFVLNYINSINESDDSKTGFASAVKSYAPMKDPVNILFLVDDKTSTNTDTIMVLNYNPSTASVNILSIPRDTEVNTSLKVPKINSLYWLGGPQLLIEHINNLFNLNIKYYMFVDIAAIRKIVDVLGGVDFDVPGRLKYDDAAQNLHIDLQKGMQHLDGAHAEQLLRFRHPNTYRNNKELYQIYDGSDLARINIQQLFLKELIRQKANVYYFSKINTILKAAFDNISETNINSTDALRLSQNISKINLNNFNNFKVLGIDDNTGYTTCYKYIGKIMNNTTKETLDGANVINQYFNSKFTFDASDITNQKYIENSIKFAPGKTVIKSTVKPHKTVTKNNPSNADTSFTGNKEPGP